ncbi:bacteriorhodopsin [Terriglobus sp.]|uniref:bacteriorhodopsin n=1 Tax=Terriglobus sp. TaxID=1889013 RepID=UPI003B006C03
MNKLLITVIKRLNMFPDAVRHISGITPSILIPQGTHMTVELWLWIGTIGMALGVVLLFFPMQKNKSVSEQGDSIAHFLVPMVAMTLYLLMAYGYGSAPRPSGRIFYYARYIDWSITTPLLLLSLVSGAVKGHVKKRGAMIAGLVISDVYMIVTGLVAGWTDDPRLKWSFYLLSCLSFVAIYALLWGPFRKLSEKSPEGETYRKKLPVLSIVWFLYPVVFLVGQQGLRLWSPVVDATLFTSLDLIAKVIYGLWAVSLVQHTGSVDDELPESGDRLVRNR